MKSILLKVELEGFGVVNHDNSKQRFLYFGSKLNHLYHPFDNVSYAKKVLYKDADGKLSDYKIKISKGCIGKGLYSNDMVGQNQNLVNNKEYLFSQLGSPYSILNGYLHTTKNKNSYKRKSPITLVDAIQTNNAFSFLEVCTTSGIKVSKDNVDDDSDISLRYEENVGEMTYKTTGSINLNELQFVSLDDYYDRASFNADDFGLFKKYMSKTVPSFNSEVKYYCIKDSYNSIPELGFKFSDSDIDFIVKYYLKRLLQLEINVNSAYVKLDSLKIKFVEDAVRDTHKSKDGWIELSTIEDIESLNIKSDVFYDEFNTDLAIAIQKDLKEKKEKEEKKGSKGKKKKED